MLQDLALKNFRNQYENLKPQKRDKIVIFSEGKILVFRDKDDSLALPRYDEVENIVDENKICYVFGLLDNNYFIYFDEGVEEFQNYRYESVRTFRQIISKDVCFAVMTAWHTYCWYKNNSYCGRCGEKTVHDEKERMKKCPRCGNMIYPRISPAVIIGVTDGDRLLLSKYAGRSYTRFALLAGYTEIGETLEETVEREVMEEVGLKVKNIRYYKSQPWGVDGNVLMGFYCDLDGDDKISLDESELSMAGWYRRGEIPAKDDGISLTREMIRMFDEGKI